MSWEAEPRTKWSSDVCVTTWVFFYALEIIFVFSNGKTGAYTTIPEYIYVTSECRIAWWNKIWNDLFSEVTIWVIKENYNNTNWELQA